VQELTGADATSKFLLFASRHLRQHLSANGRNQASVPSDALAWRLSGDWWRANGMLVTV
jgi:hypothetical protein